MTPMEHPGWKAFCEWATQNGVEPEGHVEDWLPWWECFKDGWHNGYIFEDQ